MKRFIFILLISSLFGMTACKKQLTTGNTPTPRKKSNELKIEDLQFEYLTARAKLTFGDGTDDIKATADIRVKKDSLIWISLRSGTGIEGARALISRDSVFVIDRLNKEYYKYDYDGIYQRLNFQTQFEMIQAILIGNMPMEINTRRSQKNNDFFIIKNNKGDYKTEVSVNRTYNKLQILKAEEKKSNAQLEINYEKFQEVEGQIFPFLCKASVRYNDSQKKDTRMALDFNRVGLQAKELKFPFKISPKYKLMDINNE
ncbi:DUF4292 domain-containing protein [Rapidithrix thailandica]|uniref:DUF4292 domain-containing protein n=1 Tax=Rapidithrix thailandica TaxID=413964 RepID=A0AAW9RZ67_9BACT